MTSDTVKPRVLIVGAGLSGLTLAQCLRKQGIPFQIFDRDNDISTRQGFAIAVHSIIDDMSSSFPSDMPPLRESADHLLPLKLEPQICYYGRGQRMTVENTPETPCLRLNRLLFRKWLATQIPIQWGKRLQRVEEGEKQVTVHFEDGTSASGDLLVGADGVNSVVREHMLGRPNAEVLNSVKLACIWGETTLSGDAMERQLSLGHSAYGLASKSLGFVVFVGLNKVNEDLSGDYYWLITWDDDNIDKPDHWLRHASQAAKHDHVLKITESLDPEFREIFQLTPVDGIVTKVTVYRDAEILSLPVGKVTLVGDAVHPMTPFRGEGGMHAIRDALNLSRALSYINIYDSNLTQSTLESYQREILERGHKAVALSRNAHENNKEANSTIHSWGFVAKPTSEEHVLLKHCKP
ncbi:FAD/NAD(P)-binding domain-containing protein [Xylariaceae sp. FL1651]|nr:FAD/NAD(P)-binding domain-containing protein [Xylariaceae sp. FL1651]